MDTIEKIRAEIKRLQDQFADYEYDDETTGFAYTASAVEFGDRLQGFLDTLEEKSEKPTNLDFDKAWEEYGKSKGGGAITVNVKDLARHFYELGRNEK